MPFLSMCKCWCVCVYVCACMCARIYVCVYVNACMCTRIYVSMSEIPCRTKLLVASHRSTPIYTGLQVKKQIFNVLCLFWVCVSVGVCVYVCACMCARIYVSMSEIPCRTKLLVANHRSTQVYKLNTKNLNYLCSLPFVCVQL